MEKKFKQVTANCIKIVLFGPESTGKTTLSKQLALHYKTNWVPEFSREYALKKIAEGKVLTKRDVLPIAIGQMQLENSIALKTKDILICDTNLLETMIYSQTIYKEYCPSVLKKYALANTYNLYILTSIDVPWKNDEVRGENKNRALQFSIFEETLKKHNLPYIIVSGNKEDRLQKAIKNIDKIILSKT